MLLAHLYDLCCCVLRLSHTYIFAFLKVAVYCDLGLLGFDCEAVILLHSADTGCVFKSLLNQCYLSLQEFKRIP